MILINLGILFGYSLNTIINQIKKGKKMGKNYQMGQKFNAVD